MFPSLLNPEAYRLQLEKLRAKAKQGGHRVELESEGVSLSMLLESQTRLCRHVAAEVSAGGYRLAPLKHAEVHLDGKRRALYRPDLIDALVLGAVSARLTSLLESILADSVYAYRPGRSSMSAVGRLRAELAEHRRRYAPAQRGLFVLQRDLSNYGESIPTDEGSYLWAAISSVLDLLDDRREAQVLRELLEAACRPQVRYATGRVEAMTRGLPTGSPIQQPLANLYLTVLDEQMGTRDLFYARFGDDLLVVSSSLEASIEAADTLQRVVDGLELRFNDAKTKNQYFTKPGRPLERACSLAMRPTSHIEYLGVRLNFDGRLGIKAKRVRQLLQRCRWRVENVMRVAPPGCALPWVAAALERALTESGSVAEPLREALTTWVDDRNQLRELDYQLALLCAEALSGKRGVRAFRHTTPSALREAGLSSLLQLRRREKGSA